MTITTGWYRAGISAALFAEGACERLCIGLLSLERTGRVSMANGAAEKILGAAPLGELLQSFLTEEPGVEAWLRDPRPRRMGEGGIVLARRADGRHVPVDLGLVLGGPDFAIASLLDCSVWASTGRGESSPTGLCGSTTP